MKKALVALLLVTFFQASYAQESRIKQVQKDLKEHTQLDTLRVNRLNELPNLMTVPADKLDTMANEALFISRKLHYSEGEVEALIQLAQATYQNNNLPQAHTLSLQAITLAEKLADKRHLSNALAAMGRLELLTGGNQTSIGLRN